MYNSNENRDINENHRQIRDQYNEIIFERLRVIFLLSKILYLVALTAVDIIFIIFDYDKICDKYIFTWIVANIIFQIISVISITKFSENSKCNSIFNGLNILSFFACLIIYIFRKKCEQSDGIYSLVLCHIILLGIIFIFPYILGIFLCCCFFPILLNFLVFVDNKFNRLATIDIKKLPEYIYKKNKITCKNKIIEIKQIDSVCAICLLEYEKGNKLRYLNCTHHFHIDCLDMWLSVKNNCPICRTPVINLQSV